MPYGVTTIGNVMRMAAAICSGGSGGGGACAGWYCSSTTFRPTSAKMMPPERSTAETGMLQLVISARPANPPTTAAPMAIRNERTAIRLILVSSASRVRCAKGPTILSGPNVTKSSVKIWPYETSEMASGVLCIVVVRCADVAARYRDPERR